MEVQEKLWKWYGKHKDTVDSVFEVTCDLIPGTRAVLTAMKLVHGWIVGGKQGLDPEKVEVMESMLTEMRPMLVDVVEEIEEIPAFKEAKNDQERIHAINKHKVCDDIEKILPQMAQTINMSLSRLEKPPINGRYELKQRLGKGGEGEVHKAWDKVARIEVAIKLLPLELSQDALAVESIIAEYHRLVNLLVHENIVQYRQIEQDAKSGGYFLVMDYVEGKNLRRVLLSQKGKIRLEDAVDLLMPIAAALDFAHEKKVVHCDLKPENILVRERDGKALLTDFGLAREIQNTLVRISKGTSKNISGTLSYMAPEQYQGKPTQGYTDIWALGIILYEMIAGYHPFQGTSFDHFYKIICENPLDPPENLAPEKWSLLSSMLDKNAKNRPTNAQEILTKLRGDDVVVALGEKKPAWLEEKKDTELPPLGEPLFMDEEKKTRLAELESKIEEEKKKLEEVKILSERRRQTEEETLRLREARKKVEEETKKKQQEIETILSKEEEAKRIEEIRQKIEEEEKRKLEAARQEKEKEAKKLAEVSRRKLQQAKQLQGKPASSWKQSRFWRFVLSVGSWMKAFVTGKIFLKK